jgi:Right handed beta helix region
VRAGVRSALGRAGLVLGVAAALPFAACSGPSDLTLGEAKAMPLATVYLSPSEGSDENDGTRERPWLTFKHALPALQPGSTLVLLPGTYDAASTGYFNVTCDSTRANAATYPGPRPDLASNGALGAPITVRADQPRTALLSSDGNAPSFFIDACAYWNFQDLYAQSSDFPTQNVVPDAGSVFVVGNDNHDLTFAGILARAPNRWVHSHVFRIDDRSHDVTVTDSELYDFHHNAFETSRTTGVKFLRNYINSRGTKDLTDPGAYMSEDASEGDYGIFFEETSGGLAANNVIESVAAGIGVVGRYQQVPIATPTVTITGNQVLGNVVLDPGNYGLRIDSRCNGDVPCAKAATLVTNTVVSNDAFIGGAAGISSAGAVGTRVEQVSVINAANGLLFVKEPQDLGVPSTSTTANTLATVQSVAFRADGESTWSFDHCAAFSQNPPDHDYQPAGVGVSSPVPVDPTKLGSCLVYLSAGSPLKGAGTDGQDVGAKVLAQYGDDGALTMAPLWNATTGGFVGCGAIVSDVNNDSTTAPSCINVQQRLNVGTKDCPLP